MGSMQSELNLFTFPYVLIIPERFNYSLAYSLGGCFLEQTTAAN